VACGESTITFQEAEPESKVDLARGLILYLPLDEVEAGATAHDASGNGHDGVPSENPPVPSTSIPPVGLDNSRSLRFDGANQLLDLGNPATLNVAGAVTIAAWIRPLATDGYRNIVAHGYRDVPPQELALRVNGGRYEFIAWDGSDHVARTPVPDGDIDNWHHLCGVYSGRSYRIYRDGELFAERADSFAPFAVDESWAVGGRSVEIPADRRYFDGFIDEVRIYNRALSEDEVRALVQSP
jgi:hypothetical protein